LAIQGKLIEPRKLVGLLAAMALIVFSRVLPLPEGLTREGLTAAALLFAALAMWITETMNLAVVTILVVAIMPFFGVAIPAGSDAAQGAVGIELLTMNISETFRTFAGNVFFFVLATFALTAALATSTIPTRIAHIALRLSGKSSFKLVLFFLLGSALLSNVLSNVSSSAIFSALALGLVKSSGDPRPGTSQLAKALLIAVALGAMIGGVMVPSSTATNLVIIDLLEHAGYRIPFLHWMLIGYPTGIVACLIVGVAVYLSFKPERVSDSALKAAKREAAEIGPLATREKKMLIIIALIFAFWISSTWFPALNLTLVALLGMCAFFLPGIEVLTWKQFKDNAAWDVLFLIGGVGALAAGIQATGAATWFVQLVMSDAAAWSPFMVALMASAIVCLLHVINPSGPAVAGLAAAPMIAVAISTEGNVSPIALALITSFWSNTAFVFPTDAVTVIGYSYGHYKMTEFVKFGWLPTIIMVVLIALIVPALTNMVLPMIP